MVYGQAISRSFFVKLKKTTTLPYHSLHVYGEAATLVLQVRHARVSLHQRSDVMTIAAYKPRVVKTARTGLLARLALSKQPLGAHKQILAGFQLDMVAKLSKETSIEVATICEVVGINRATYYRKAKSPSDNFTVEQSAKLYAFARVMDAATHLFNGDSAGAATWLNSPAKGLGGEKPLALLTTPTGVEAVMDLIGRIEHGVIS